MMVMRMMMMMMMVKITMMMIDQDREEKGKYKRREMESWKNLCVGERAKHRDDNSDRNENLGWRREWNEFRQRGKSRR